MPRPWLEMTHHQAHQILDRIRDGADYPLHIICKALEITGDL
jgi:hypothetical protein